MYPDVFCTLTQLCSQQRHSYNIREKQDNCCCCRLLTEKAKNNPAGVCTHAHQLCFVYIFQRQPVPSGAVYARHPRQNASLNCDAVERSQQVFHFTHEDEFKHGGKSLSFHRHQGRTCAPLDGGIPSRQSRHNSGKKSLFQSVSVQKGFARG